MDDDLERRAGKPPHETHPVGEGGPSDPDPSDYADPRVAQPGEDPPGEDPPGEDARRRRRGDRTSDGEPG